MWDKAALLSLFVGLCLANRIALANKAETEHLYRRYLPAGPVYTPQDQEKTSNSAGAAGTTAASGTGLASTAPTIIAPGLDSNEINQLSSLIATLDPSGTESFIFVPASGTQSASLLFTAAGNTPWQTPPATSTAGQNGATAATAASASSVQATVNGQSSVVPSQSEASSIEPWSFWLPIISTLGTGALSTPVDSTGVSSSSVPNPTSAESGTFTTPSSSGVFSFSISAPSSRTGIGSQSTIPSPTSLSSTTTSTQTSSTSDSSTSSSSTSSETSSTASSSRSTSTTISISTSASTPTNSPTATNGPFESFGSGVTASPGRTHPLTNGAIVGIAVGAAIALILLGAALLYLLHRRTKPANKSPQVYPEEAYLYDPPMNDEIAAAMSGPRGTGTGYRPLAPMHYGLGGQGMPPPTTDGHYNPYVPAVPAEAALLGAGAAPSAATTRGGYAAVPSSSTAHDEYYDSRAVTPPPSPFPPRREAGESTALLDVGDITIGHRPQQPSVDTTFNDEGRYRDAEPALDARDPFVDPTDPDDVARQERWPLNPHSDSGLSSPPGTSNGVPSPESRRVGSSGGVGVSPSMREVRRAWGWE